MKPKIDTLTPEQKRTMIAQSCGWRWVYMAEIAAQNRWLPSGTNEPFDSVAIPPDYLRDLNSCAEMEKTLTYEQQPYYVAALKRLMMSEEGVSDFHVCNASAEIRASAYLIAKGLAV